MDSIDKILKIKKKINVLNKEISDIQDEDDKRLKLESEKYVGKYFRNENDFIKIVRVGDSGSLETNHIELFVFNHSDSILGEETREVNWQSIDDLTNAGFKEISEDEFVVFLLDSFRDGLYEEFEIKKLYE